MRSTYAIAAALLLAGCATRAEAPIVRDRIVEVKVPVAVGCPDRATIPARPRRLSEDHPTLPTGKDALETAKIQLSLVSAKVLEWIGYGDEADGVMKACSEAAK